ncbi:hypothetical protein ATI53_104911 [Salipiger aestuarii]|uniref:Transposase IS30-like HTH domain-containing protein n=1 Tax=Salipiger aestuarii TaxID=568098 RepID=A0A327XT27_9RHOB|nr:helix-turn-helix domain-containing protein [Salipiger aestuarii]RAK11311.1 hypothetical protein ATI53_104911 [Salipiger aestuarii]
MGALAHICAPRLTLAKGDALIALASVPKEICPRDQSLLSAQERDRADLMLHPDTRREFMAGRVLIRQTRALPSSATPVEKQMVIYWRESALGAVRAQLSVKEHVQLERWKPAKTPGREMARVLQRSNATIYREITRDWFSDACLPGHDGDHGGAAHQKAIDQRARQPKLIRYPLLRNRVVERIRNGWTPGQIGNRPIQEGAKLRLCQETICRYVSSKQGMAQKLWWYLPEHRKRRAPEFDRDISTLNRPENDAHRREFGHREGGFMLVKQSPGQARHLSGRTCQPLHRAAEEREQAHKTGHDRDGGAGFARGGPQVHSLRPRHGILLMAAPAGPARNPVLRSLLALAERPCREHKPPAPPLACKAA